MNYRQLIIVGAGGHGKVAADIARCMGYTDVAFLDDRPNAHLRIVGKTDEYATYLEHADFFVAIGHAPTRERITEQLMAAGATVVSLIHPQSVVAQSAVIENGVMVAPGAVVGVDAVIKDGVIVNTGASVDHDASVDAYTHVSVGARIAGTVHVGKRCMIGAGAVVINNVDIADDVIVGAGAVVVRTIDQSGTYIGVPAKRKASET